jgi:hypothetical protein
MSDDQPPPRPGLGAYLAAFEAPDFRFDDWRGSLSPTAQAFAQDAADLGWVRGELDWGAWVETDEAATLRDDPTAIAGANSHQLAMMLTALIRMNRFSNGELASAYSSGMLTAIVRRIATLEHEGII